MAVPPYGGGTVIGHVDPHSMSGVSSGNAARNLLYQDASHRVSGDRWNFEVSRAENGWIIRANFVPDQLTLGVQNNSRFFVVPEDAELNVGQHIQAIMVSKKLEG